MIRTILFRPDLTFEGDWTNNNQSTNPDPPNSPPKLLQGGHCDGGQWLSSLLITDNNSSVDLWRMSLSNTDNYRSVDLFRLLSIWIKGNTRCNSTH